MAKKLIEAENISKYYKLGVLGAQSFKEDLRDWWKRARKKSNTEEKSHNDHIWALRNVSFDVNQGDILGLIGRNGAGKSTLLKIISRITLPTSGHIYGTGRIASLLEVGTGFHGELTGRENIYLNGHIMGMKKNEIDRKFDEIIEFSGVSRFLDTPVKRYSSGMYVRLAFAVAANLDPEILVIDEVLAVGDTEFQKKCLVKIKSIAREEGKTILFVSHNIQTIRNICNRGLLLENGKMTAFGETESVLNLYASKSRELFLGNDYSQLEQQPGNELIRVNKVELKPNYLDDLSVIDIRTELLVKFEFYYYGGPELELSVNVQLFNNTGDFIFELGSQPKKFINGLISGTTVIPGNFLNDGVHYISLAFLQENHLSVFHLDACIIFEVEDYKSDDSWRGKWSGIVRPVFPVNLESYPND